MSESTEINRSVAFVAMPFKRPFTQTYELSIVPALRESGFTPLLAPDVRVSRDIMSNIYSGIWNSRAVIADLSGCNPNVLFELGIALAINRRTILLTQNIKELPFDLRRDRVIIYRRDETGRRRLRTDLSRELSNLDHQEWLSVPSWKEGVDAEILPVLALLRVESQVFGEVWIIEPEESFQDTVFHNVILDNLARGVRYRFLVLDRPDIERAFETTLGRFYGEQAQVVYVDERRLQIPLAVAIFDPTTPRERGFQYFPNGKTVFGIELSRARLLRARQLFISMWTAKECRIIGKRSLGFFR